MVRIGPSSPVNRSTVQTCSKPVSPSTAQGMRSAASPAASSASSAVLPGSPQAASPSRAAAENSVLIRSCLSHVHGPGKGTARSFPAGPMGGQPVGEDVGPQQGREGPVLPVVLTALKQRPPPAPLPPPQALRLL